MKKIIVLILSVFLLSACGTNPVKEGQGYQIRSQADQAALDAEQAREIEREEQDWLIYKRNQLAELWARVEETAQAMSKAVTVVFFLSLAVMILVFAGSLSYGSVKTAAAYGTMLHIRARLVHPDRQTGLRPLLVWDDVKSLPAETFLGRFGLQHVRETKWYLNDTATGQSGMIDTEQPAGDAQLEMYRQLILQWQVARQQAKTALTSREGEVAEAIGQASPQLPDAGRVLLGMDEE